MAKPLVVSDPNILMGKPVIVGTRITEELILEKLAAGESIEQILDAHPRLTREAVLAAIAFAKDALRADVIYPLVETTRRVSWLTKALTATSSSDFGKTAIRYGMWPRWSRQPLTTSF